MQAESNIQAVGSRKVCPECHHVLQGMGWEGIDAHQRTKHERIMA